MDETKTTAKASILDAIRNGVSKSIDAGTLVTPSIDFGGLSMNPVYVYAAGGFHEAIKPKFWEDCKIQRNGKYTTVIWKDGTVTRVTCQDSDYPDDLRAFEEALAKKLYGSRTALKKFVEKRTVDVTHKKESKKFDKRWKNDRARRQNGEVIARDSNGVELKVGDAVYIKDFSGVDWGGKVYRIDKIGDCTVTINGLELPSECFTKVRTEPPYSVGDWVVFRNPKENYLVHSEAWTRYMTAEKPLKIEKINGTNLLCSDGCVYESLWIRGAEKTEEDTEE